MAGYRRKTALEPTQILERADDLLQELVGLSKSKESAHAASYSGAEGTVTLNVHPHGPYVEVIAVTDGLRTSRVDYEIQKFLNTLPYEPGDRGGPGSGEPS